MVTLLIIDRIYAFFHRLARMNSAKFCILFDIHRIRAVLFHFDSAKPHADPVNTPHKDRRSRKNRQVNPVAMSQIRILADCRFILPQIMQNLHIELILPVHL